MLSCVFPVDLPPGVKVDAQDILQAGDCRLREKAVTKTVTKNGCIAAAVKQ
jgi:hypothetical protein